MSDEPAPTTSDSGGTPRVLAMACVKSRQSAGGEDSRHDFGSLTQGSDGFRGRIEPGVQHIRVDDTVRQPPLPHQVPTQPRRNAEAVHALLMPSSCDCGRKARDE